MLGFRNVWYFHDGIFEDPVTGASDPVKEKPSADCAHCVSFLGRIMREFDMGDRWIVQDTGWSDHLPSGAGARAYARNHFDAAKVCAELLE